MKNSLRNTMIFFMMYLVAGSLSAQTNVPQGFNFQAVMRSSSGNIMGNQPVTLRLSVISGGSTLYQEVHTGNTNQYGLISVPAGQGSPLSGSFNLIDWSAGNLSILVEANTGTGFVDMGSNAMLSVPYSLFSQKAEVAVNMSLDDLVNVDVPSPASGEVLKWTGSSWQAAPDAVETYVAGTGISISNNVVTNTGDVDPLDDMILGSVAGGDLNGAWPIPEVSKIRGVPVSSFAPSDGQVLTYNAGNGQWTPQTINMPSMSGTTSSGSVTPPQASMTFITPTVTITVMNGQRLLIQADAALGSTNSSGAYGLNIFPAYRLQGSTTIQTIGGGMFGLTIPANQRFVYSVNGITPTLASGTYEVGMAGSSSAAVWWNNNEYGYTTAIILP